MLPYYLISNHLHNICVKLAQFIAKECCKLLYCNSGRPYTLKAKYRISQSGDRVTYWACDSLELVFRDVLKKCGYKGASRHTGRRSWASTMNAKGVSLDKIVRALGHSDPQCSLEYIDVSANQLSNSG